MGGVCQDIIKNELSNWYREHALKKLIDKAHRYTNKIGVNPSQIDIKDYKSRWGGCSHDGVVSFNWHIIMAPNRIVDYVVVHELCHLIHHDHSEKYWKLVERVFPDWRECKQWLKVNGKALTL